MNCRKQISIFAFVSLLPFMVWPADKSLVEPATNQESRQSSDTKTNAHEGSWRPIAAVLGGSRLPPVALEAITLKIEGNCYEVAVAGEKDTDKGNYTLDLTTRPKRMTITSTNGPNRGKTFLAIYEMKDAQSMRVCYDLSGTEFPKEFKAPKGTHLYLVGYRLPKE